MASGADASAQTVLLLLADAFKQTAAACVEVVVVSSGSFTW
jgi:hypothetical protein